MSSVHPLGEILLWIRPGIFTCQNLFHHIQGRVLHHNKVEQRAVPEVRSDFVLVIPAEVPCGFGARTEVGRAMDGQVHDLLPVLFGQDVLRIDDGIDDLFGVIVGYHPAPVPGTALVVAVAVCFELLCQRVRQVAKVGASFAAAGADRAAHDLQLNCT